MLELKNIKKTYTAFGVETKALNGISIAFREKEFVAVLGQSGSGKTTALNIIGGLDRYDAGELIIKGKRTADFGDKEWDAYRNNSVGFVFQSYNLITHLGIIANVELGMTLSGVSVAEKRRRAVEVLEKVGLKDHLHKNPNQLSGGQMQRVAIARALANDPEILLCDEPTGALDSTTSVQIMDLIKDLSKDRLVIVVTHNPEIAEKYADRIVHFSDGVITGDTKPLKLEENPDAPQARLFAKQKVLNTERPEKDEFSLKMTSMSFITALRLSFNNLLTKKGRAFLTAFASSIGIIGIAVIMSLSVGFQIQVDEFQASALSEFPVIMSRQTALVDRESIQTTVQSIERRGTGTEGAAADVVYAYDPMASMVMHSNNFSDAFLAHLESIDPAVCSSIGYTRIVNMNVLAEQNGEIRPVSFGGMGGSDTSAMAGGMSGIGFASYPVALDADAPSYIERHYELLAGEYPRSVTDLTLLIDELNCLDERTLNNLGFDTADSKTFHFDEIIGREYKIITNDNFYEKTDYGTFLPGMDYADMYGKDGNITVTVTGIVRLNEDTDIGLLGNGIVYSDGLAKLVIESSEASEIVSAQRASDNNVMTDVALDEAAKEQFLSYLGGNAMPYLIMAYPVNFDAKDVMLGYIDTFNAAQTEENRIVYTDLAATITDMTSDIMSAITVVLIAFAAIALVVSLIMIAIITYTSVLERTKEIGVLRALGARKKDITRVFNAETCILGVLSGTLGVGIAYALTVPINRIILNMTDLPDVARLPVSYAVFLLIISTLLTMLGGFIPARMASRKDAVEALRTE